MIEPQFVFWGIVFSVIFALTIYMLLELCKRKVEKEDADEAWERWNGQPPRDWRGKKGL